MKAAAVGIERMEQRPRTGFNGLLVSRKGANENVLFC
jgi:hypothetical protein